MSDDKPCCGNCNQGAKAQGDPEAKLLESLGQSGYQVGRIEQLTSSGDNSFTEDLDRLHAAFRVHVPELVEASLDRKRIAALEAENAKLKEAIEIIAGRVNQLAYPHGLPPGVSVSNSAEFDDLMKGEPNA
jgi:hypothetical protein